MSTTYDMIIVGGGTAGMCCAIEAAERGATVAVIEKDRIAGGAMHWSGGHMSAGGTQLQKRNDIDDSREEHLADIIRINQGSGDLDLIRLAVEEATDTLDWLDGLGFPWAADCPRIIYGHVPYTKARTQYGSNKAISILETIMPLWQNGIDHKQIHFYNNHSFVGLDRQSDNYDTVIAKNIKDEEVRFQGNHIVITSGGYGSNPSYFESKHKNILLNSSTYPNSTGEVAQYLESQNAAFRMADLHLPSVGGIELQPGSGKSNFNEAWAMVLTSIYRQPRDIYVTTEGKRFLREDEINADVREREVVKLKNWWFYVIFDEASLLERNENGLENPIIIGWDTEKIKKEAKRNKAIFSANSIRELATKIDVDSDTLTETVDSYNIMVENGEDPDFGRTYLENKITEGPYYAVKVFASVLVTFGGIHVNADLQVLDNNQQIIPGIYAAGEVLGLGALSGNAFCSGMAITPALSFGRILGRSLTK